MKYPIASLESRGTGREAAFTLIELVAVVAILGLLATLLLPEVSNIRERAQKVVCISHLRSLHVSLGSYLNDNEAWPQCPEEAEGAAAEQFWLDTLKDYGGDPKVWLCPTLLGQLGADFATNSDAPKLHYTPTQFDENPMSPRKWPGQPWLIEIGDMHHCGNLMIRTDGRVQSFNEALQSGE
ncbi:MAG: prepilin-type N-terminal cleavage/methylation domain-containing protein [Chthoniobacteraceae bacterium]|nr:prepilin-type N-terminal cleavage/methylation domain-containing protein [Chthoniobacteraceae bacterium]